jgi:hypothetical protein
MTLPPFDHVAVDSLEGAAALLGEQQGRVIAGGTDLLGSLKNRIHPDHPRLLIDIKPSAGVGQVRLEDTNIRIGALTTLSEVAEDELVNARIPLLAQAARAVGSPQIRNMATVGGNICQEPRCWYYRAPDNAFHCLRKVAPSVQRFLVTIATTRSSVERGLLSFPAPTAAPPTLTFPLIWR